MLIKNFQFNQYISLIGGILFITMVSVSKTILFPLLEPVSFFFSLLICLAVLKKNKLGFIISSILGIASKEILVFASLLWAINTIQLKKGYMKDNIKNLLISTIPIIAYCSIRLALKGDAFSVNYSYNLLKGELPPYAAVRIVSLRQMVIFMLQVFCSFSFLWAGLYNLKRNRFLYKSAIIIPFVILATFLLSSSVVRVIGVVFPIVIPMFLYFFKPFKTHSP